MHQHATWGSEAALAGVDSVEHLNVFGQLAPQALKNGRAREAHAVRTTAAGSGDGSAISIRAPTTCAGCTTR